jgi:antirestriction protein ArdC
MSPKADAYGKITDKIIAALEQGVVPWNKPWRSVNGNGPTSLQTGREYRGINVWLLSIEAQMRGYTSPYWVTFKQAKERGGTVRKGEKSTEVVLWKPFKKTIEVDGKDEEKSFLMMRTFNVFNVDQCDGIEVPKSEPLPERDPIEACEQIVLGYYGPTIKHGGNRAYYSPALDYIQMPQRNQFTSSEAYYGTLFHELAHSTGHEDRLNRTFGGSFGTETYSKEELVAEMAASFLRGEAGIDLDIEQSASYISSWLSKLKDDRKMVVQAAAAAQKASDLILGLGRGEEEGADAPPRSTTRRNHEGRIHRCPCPDRQREAPGRHPVRVLRPGHPERRRTHHEVRQERRSRGRGSGRASRVLAVPARH